MNPESLALIQSVSSAVIALLVVATLYTLFSPMLQGDKLKKRMGAVADTREHLRQDRMSALRKKKGLRTETKGSIKQLVDNLSLEKLLEASNLRDKLAQAGMRGERPIYLFYVFRLLLPVVFFLIGAVFLIGLNTPEWDMLQRVFATVVLVVFAYYIPPLYVANVANKRLAAIVPVFPDALDLLLICVESGMSVELAFAKVASEMAENSIELAEEFSLTTAELSYLQSRRQAFENLARRNNHQGIRAVSTSLIQAERYGTPLGDSLRTMATENRQMRVLQAEKKAASLPAKLTVPMILFFLPVLFIVILTPAAIRIGGALGDE